MKKLCRPIFALVSVLALAGVVSAQVITDPPTGGGTTTIVSGTTPITGGGTTQLCFNDAAFISCGDAGLTYNKTTDFLSVSGGIITGSVSTAGRSILTIRDTISGGSTTSNFLNITGAMPATLTTETSGALLAIAGSGGSQISSGLSILMTGNTAGGFPSYGLKAENQETGTYTIGVKGLGNAGASTAVGVIGQSTGATNKIGGYFALANQDPPSTSAALVIDNVAVAANIFEARDNGTAVFTIADGGLATASTGLNITGAASFTAPQLAVSTATTTGFGWNTSDLNHYYASAGAGFLEIGPNAGAQGIAIKRNATCNSNATSCGYNFSAGPGNSVDAFFTSEAAATFQLGFDVNGAAIAQTLKAADGITGTDVAGSNMILAGGRGTGAGAGGNLVLQTSPTLGTGTTAQTLQQRDTIVAKQFNLTSGAIATFAVATLGNDTHAGGSIEYCVYGADATTAVSECGRADYSAIDVTAGAGGEVCTFTKVGTPAQALSGATLTVAFTGTTGTDLCSLRVTSTITTIASPVNHYIKYRIINNGLSSTNIVTPQ